jgi:hypothetical protein
MNYPTMPAMPPAPPERTSARRRQLTLTIVALTTCGAFFTAGVLTGHAIGSDEKETTRSSSPSAKNQDADPVDEEPFEITEPEPEFEVPDVADFSIELDVKSKQCFGSAGCNVTVEPELSYAYDSEDLDPDATYEITYEISGGEDGEVIDTLDLTNQEDVSFSETMVSTTSSGTELTAEVTSVDVY